MITTRSSNFVSRPLHGLRLGSADPSDKSLGYFQPSAKRGLGGTDFSGKATLALDLVAKRIDVVAKPIDLGARPIDLGARPIDLAAKRIDVVAKPIDLVAQSIDLGQRTVILGPWSKGF
jgi:hypothetical protein